LSPCQPNSCSRTSRRVPNLATLPSPRHVPPNPWPATDKGEAARTRIVGTAAELMHARGVARTSVEDVRVTSAAIGFPDVAVLRIPT
jgi:hypothetical protein